MKKSVQKVGMEQLRSCHGQGTSAEALQDSQISEVVIKKAQAGDLPRILEIYAYAREFMKRTGNPNQWKENTASGCRRRNGAWSVSENRPFFRRKNWTSAD